MRRLEYLFMALVFVTAGAVITFSYFQGSSLRSVARGNKKVENRSTIYHKVTDYLTK